MVATAFPYAKQSTYLDAPVATPFDVVCLAWWIGELRYGDALVTENLRLERQCIQEISDVEDDSAPDGLLVSGTYVEFLFFKAYKLYGVVEVRSVKDSKRTPFRRELARCLLEHGWQAAGTRITHGCAVTPPNRKLGRVRRLLKG